MIILEGPYLSDLMIDWLVESQHPVLANEFASSQKAPLNLVGETEAAERINAGERLYTNSENSLAWVLANTDNENLHRAISFCKDKAAMRELLAPLAPDVFFARYDYDQLAAVDVDTLPLPVVLKPSVGFCSLGVFVIESATDWRHALDVIRTQAESWAKLFPDAVVDLGYYLVESYISGTEYALDAYFDDQGKAQVLAIFRHDFASAEDTSDRLYYECDEVVDEMLEPMTAWLNQVNELMGVRNFPFHVEVRVSKPAHGGATTADDVTDEATPQDATVTEDTPKADTLEHDKAGDTMLIVPIEFNPLRFAGLCFTDVSWYAWGLLTYQAFLENTPVDLPSLAQAHTGDVFTMALLKPDEEAEAHPSGDFDYDAFCSHFTHVLDMRRFDLATSGIYGCLFLKTDASTTNELDFLLHANLSDFCS